MFAIHNTTYKLKYEGVYNLLDLTERYNNKKKKMEGLRISPNNFVTDYAALEDKS